MLTDDTASPAAPGFTTTRTAAMLTIDRRTFIAATTATAATVAVPAAAAPAVAAPAVAAANLTPLWSVNVVGEAEWLLEHLDTFNDAGTWLVLPGETEADAERAAREMIADAIRDRLDGEPEAFDSYLGRNRPLPGGPMAFFQDRTDVGTVGDPLTGERRAELAAAGNDDEWEHRRELGWLCDGDARCDECGLHSQDGQVPTCVECYRCCRCVAAGATHRPHIDSPGVEGPCPDCPPAA